MILKKLFKNINKINKIVNRYKDLIDSIEIQNNSILFMSSQDLLGNSRALFNYIYEHHKDKYKIYWLFKDTDTQHNLPEDVNILYLTNKQDIDTCKTIKYVILATLYLIPTHKKQIVINLWHGIPFKTIGYNQNVPTKYFPTENLHCFVSSDFSKLLIHSCFNSDFSKIYITGQARDVQILSSKYDKSNLLDILKLPKNSNYKKIILYSPTFKDASNNKYLPDVIGINSKIKNIFYFKDYSYKDLQNYLANNNILLVIKPHFLEEHKYKKLITESNNIKLIYDCTLVKHNCNLYDFFNCVDLLITDYSSIALDWLLTDKPCIYIHSTIKEYTNSRNFIFPDNINFFMAGIKVYTQVELLEAINISFTTDITKDKRKELIPLFHKYTTGNACKRILEVMNTL